MKKYFILIMLLFLYLGIRIYINDSKSIKSLYKITIENYKDKKEIINNNKKLQELKKITKKQTIEKKLNKTLKNFIMQRYKFKYNDYSANFIKISKVKNNKNHYYIKVEINFSVKRATTLLTVISIFYKEEFLVKLKVVNKHKMILYLDKAKLVLSRNYANYKRKLHKKEM